MKAIILAAGISTRLRPLTDERPKPMLPVCGRPMIEHIVRQLVANDLCDIVITTHYKAARIREHFGDGTNFGAHIMYAHEETLMNTAGSLKLLARELDGDFLVIGGNDLLPAIDLKEFARFHKRRGGIGTIALKRLESSLVANFGQGILDAEGRLIRFEEKPTNQISDLIHTTYQIYAPRVLEFVPEGVPCSIPEHMVRRVIASGENSMDM